MKTVSRDLLVSLVSMNTSTSSSTVELGALGGWDGMSSPVGVPLPCPTSPHWMGLSKRPAVAKSVSDSSDSTVWIEQMTAICGS